MAGQLKFLREQEQKRDASHRLSWLTQVYKKTSDMADKEVSDAQGKYLSLAVNPLGLDGIMDKGQMLFSK